MKELEKLGRLFRPVQPRFKEGGSGVSYAEFAPDPLLSGYICCYWQLRSKARLNQPFVYTAVADGCIDFFFDLNDLQENFAMGFSSTSTAFHLKNDFHYAGIRFFPGALSHIFPVKASELTNQCFYLNEVIPAIYKGLIALLDNRSASRQLKRLFDQFFKKLVFSKPTTIDIRFVESLSIILQSGGSFRVERDITAGVSSRHLRRLFDFYIGASPKEFNRIVRFQNFLNQHGTRYSLRKEKPYYDLGYYDQSHFIRDFKTLYGLSPLKALIE
ncbi:MAG: DUF6597 domain-containing transcriptional factor [Bacteroidota bacterium]